MSWPGLATWELHTPASYVVDRDLAELPDKLAQRYASELRQWRRRDRKRKVRREWLSPVEMALVAVHGLYRGLQGGGQLGTGIQCSAASWAERLGCAERAVTKAFARLKSLGLVERWRCLVAHQWQDGSTERSHADAHGISYLTGAGVEWLAEHAGKVRRRVVLSTWEAGGRPAVVLIAGGIVGRLLETSREKLRRLALRLSPLSKRDRPEAENSNDKRKTEARRGAPQGGRASERSGSRRPRASSEPGAPAQGAGMGADRARLWQLFRQGQLTPRSAWPDLWGPALKKYQPRTKRHWWLIRECERLVERFTRLELAGPSTSHQPAVNQRDP